jgi:anaphase-promoting complex subunit 3
MSFSAPDSEPSFRKPSHVIQEEDQQQQSLPLSRLLTLVGDAHRHRCCFRLMECEACILQLPRSHSNTAWAQNTLGLAYFHHHQYKSSLKYFAASHKYDPCRLEGVEFYSTVMWILKMEHDLAALAQHCLSVSRLRPESWCVVGNCFSLNRECDSAIKYFQRAVQCNSSFAYAYTLAGHEHHQNDDFECAMQCFRAALKCQPRHYQAWYGLGMVFQKQERLSSAEYHFRRAREINPRNSGLDAQLGTILVERGKGASLDEARELLESAVRLDPNNCFARMKLAVVHSRSGQLQQALTELELVRQLQPKSMETLFALGKLLFRMGNTSLALVRFFSRPLFLPATDALPRMRFLHFKTGFARCRLNHALDCDSRQSNIIKSLIDRLHEEVLPPYPFPDLPWCNQLIARDVVSQRSGF